MAKIILTDLADREIGTAEKMEAHTRPLLHRAFSVFLYHQDAMLIQQRAKDKYHTGGLWANTCCSHPRPGEPTVEAACRRLQEETGIACQNLQELFSFPYFYQFTENLFEYEYDHVFLGKLAYRLPIDNITFDRQEIAAMEWIPFNVLLEDMSQQPQKYAPWFLIAAPQVIEYLCCKK